MQTVKLWLLLMVYQGMFILLFPTGFIFLFYWFERFAKSSFEGGGRLMLIFVLLLFVLTFLATFRELRLRVKETDLQLQSKKKGRP
jgi:membrane protein YdbS with pleckstrin-like domain